MWTMTLLLMRFVCEPQRAYYFGSRLLVEVDIVLPEDMLLKEAHDIAEALQNQLEKLSNVERVRVNTAVACAHKSSVRVLCL